VREQVAERHRFLCGAEARGAVGVETIEDLRGGERGQVLAGGVVERELALFDHLERGDCGDGFGH
jgi:hypothetical protein